MLRRVKGSIVERLSINRIAGVADLASDRVRELAARERIVLFTELVAAAQVSATTLVSVVMPTRNRRDLLLHALASVRAQSYPNWELVVIDDGSTDGSSEAVEDLGDDRIDVIRTEGEGAAAARNIGLRHARGEWVTFLDDDNTMAPFWLKAVARFGQQNASIRVLYGAQVREQEPDAIGTFRNASFLFVEPFDLQRLLSTNYIDLGALAVHSSVPELWFDEELSRFIDWEMIARLGSTETVQPIPVWTGAYFTDQASRITLSTQRQRLDAGKDFAKRLADPKDPVGRPGHRPPTPS